MITIANNDISSTDQLTINHKNLSDVAFSGSYNDLTDKPNIGSGGMLATRWEDDNNWYRTYDDGFIEQGGQLGSSDSRVTFPQPFNELPKSITFSQTNPSSSSVERIAHGTHPTTTGMTLSGVSSTTTSSGAYWYACGY